jgi:hypothetical protein
MDNLQWIIFSKTISSHFDELQALQMWLRAPDVSIKFNEAIERRAAGTGEWILSHSQYAEWRQNGGVLCIQGKAGSGKTVILAAILEDLYLHQYNQACCFYFFDNRDNTKTKYVGFLKSIILQLASLSKELLLELQKFQQESSRGLQPSEKDFENLAKRFIESMAPVILGIDAMDECTEQTLVLGFLENLKEDLQIIITSRKSAQRLVVNSTIHLDNDNVNADIEKYINEAFYHGQLSEELHTKVLATLVQGAEGK